MPRYLKDGEGGNAYFVAWSSRGDLFLRAYSQLRGRGCSPSRCTIPEVSVIYQLTEELKVISFDGAFGFPQASAEDMLLVACFHWSMPSVHGICTTRYDAYLHKPISPLCSRNNSSRDPYLKQPVSKVFVRQSRVPSNSLP
jgi:hypothetical protein